MVNIIIGILIFIIVSLVISLVWVQKRLKAKVSLTVYGKDIPLMSLFKRSFNKAERKA